MPSGHTHKLQSTLAFATDTTLHSPLTPENGDNTTQYSVWSGQRMLSPHSGHISRAPVLHRYQPDRMAGAGCQFGRLYDYPLVYQLELSDCDAMPLQRGRTTCTGLQQALKSMQLTSSTKALPPTPSVPCRRSCRGCSSSVHAPAHFERMPAIATAGGRDPAYHRHNPCRQSQSQGGLLCLLLETKHAASMVLLIDLSRA